MEGCPAHRAVDGCPVRDALMTYHTWLGKCLKMPYHPWLLLNALQVKREMGAKPGSVLPTTASKTGILYAPLVERCKTAALQAAGRGSIPLGSAICPLLLIG